ncbi:arsenate reductase ArsC [Nitrogeniibacter aestuarii]|uniref:arsenate reductase ArsC n=1 Tax=Nitrogeniibacter aestuarii TaxID=2815343 RepID=UPI001E46E4BE|nr:arsenate reductase ArsC [Nitrogeniibacter aestuarii]
MKNTYNVLFLCNRNSARSIMAESLLNRMGEGHFKAWSAGARPSGVVNPHALQLLREHDLPTQGLHSKHWSEFETPQAPVFDFIITLCDKVSGEARPDWPGHGVSAHWSIEDPAEVFGDEAACREAVHHAFRLLTHRIGIFLSLPFSHFDHMALHEEVTRVGSERPG